MCTYDELILFTSESSYYGMGGGGYWKDPLRLENLEEMYIHYVEEIL